MLKYIPNTLTFIRLLLIAPFLLCLYKQQYAYAFYIFLVAGFTDCLDGWLARHFNWKSFFGSFLDPLADKLLVTSSFVSLALIGALPWWLVILVFLRDCSISFGIIAWYWFIKQRLHFAPSRLSKWNTTFQLTLVTLCLFELAYFKFPAYCIDSLIFLTAVTTSITYLDYMFTWAKKAWPNKVSSQ